ncbi:hypothetical protein Leryth_012624 [Lithospermum erythrorhizon]|nr:hypothetical protein Leryth_012624 [Lithospermum erythrorhizon]
MRDLETLHGKNDVVKRSIKRRRRIRLRGTKVMQHITCFGPLFCSQPSLFFNIRAPASHTYSLIHYCQDATEMCHFIELLSVRITTHNL